MNEKDRAAVEEFAARVRALFPSAQIWAFGSRARGEASWESDLDVCVVLDEFDADIRKTVGNIAWEVGFEREVLISTVVFSKEMFERGRCSVSGLVRTIREEGVAA
ncbi:nucleotidyltransferase domain-containing protein [Candidatus Sumerlaeota bacterium]|nr:nucleotidyltransferase domain-containing protein [Candidatus Sumerlaeota bacterium]